MLEIKRKSMRKEEDITTSPFQQEGKRPLRGSVRWPTMAEGVVVFSIRKTWTVEAFIGNDGTVPTSCDWFFTKRKGRTWHERTILGGSRVTLITITCKVGGCGVLVGHTRRICFAGQGAAGEKP